MLFPNFVCVDNFLDEPDKVVDLANTFEFSNGRNFPGKRTTEVHTLDWNFFNWINLKMAAILYANNVDDIRFQAYTYFQKIKPIKYDHWVHTDDMYKMTGILYLNKNHTSGTSIFKAKDFKATLVHKHPEIKYSYFENEEGKAAIKVPDHEVEKARDETNSGFERTFSVEGIYNRLILFDGSTYHASNPATSDEERLTLITFFKDITLENQGIRYPVPTSRAI